MPTDDGWDTYSKLVLQQLEAVSKGIEALRDELHAVKQELTELKAKEDRIHELKEWKEKIDEVASPTHFSKALEDIDNLKIFRTKAVTIFTVIQFVMALAIMYAHYM